MLYSSSLAELKTLTSRVIKIFLPAFALLTLLWSVAALAFGQVGNHASERQLPAGSGRAEELFQSALLLVDAKGWKSARQPVQEAINLWLHQHEPGKAAWAALQIGDCFRQARKYQESLYYYKQALEVRPLSGSIKATVYNAIAQVYWELYELDLAR